jgi:hypothetical protein
MHPRALLRAGDSLYLAGATDSEQLLKGEGGLVQVIPTTGGDVVTELPLSAPPVFDGMASANGRLYVSLADGSLTCLGATARLQGR